MPRRKTPEKLPKHVHRKKGEWYVGLNFPKAARSESGKIIYQQIARRCEPKTADRASEVVALIKAEYALRAAAAPANPHRTALEFLRLFVAAKKKSVERRTFDFYAAQIRQHVEDSNFAQIKLTDLKPLDVQNFYDGKTCSADAIRKLHQFLGAAFNQAVKWEAIPKNPAAGVILPKKTKSNVAAFTIAEAQKFIEICRQTDDRIVLEFALESAARPEEYLALDWSDIDLEARTAHIRRAVAVGFRGGGFEFKATKTLGSNRTIIFSEQMRARLILHRQGQQKKIAELRREIKSDAANNKKNTSRQIRAAVKRATAKTIFDDYLKYNLVFPSSTGKPQSRLNLNRRDFKDILSAAGLDTAKFSLYSLRRTAATLLASKINPKELAAFLGHTDVSTTMKYYVMVTEDSRYKASLALSEIFY